MLMSSGRRLSGTRRSILDLPGWVRPDIVEMQNAEIEAWGDKLAAMYDNDGVQTKSSVPQPSAPTSKPTPGASTSSDNAPKPENKNIDSTTYVGFVQQFENDEDDADFDFADDAIFSSYVTMTKRKRY